ASCSTIPRWTAPPKLPQTSPAPSELALVASPHKRERRGHAPCLPKPVKSTERWLTAFQNPLQRLAAEFGAVFEFQLAFDLLAVRLDGMDAQPQLIGDAAGREAASDEFEDFEFAIRKGVDRRLVGLQRPS